VTAPATARRRTVRLAVLAATALVIGLCGQPATAVPQVPTTAPLAPLETVKPSPTGVYLVQLDDAPVIEYDGDIAGLPATKVLPGRRLSREASQVRSYVGHLTRERSELLGRVADAKKLYDYNYTYAGFSAQMSHDEAVALAKSSGVKSVEPSEIHQQDTVDTPRFLGLSGEGGAWLDVRRGAGDESGDLPVRSQFYLGAAVREADGDAAAVGVGYLDRLALRRQAVELYLDARPLETGRWIPVRM